MRSKRIRKPSSIEPGQSVPDGREARDQATFLFGAEDARLEAEQKYRDIFENAVEGIFQTRPGGGFIAANPALARMLGFESPEDLIRARAQTSGGTYYVHPERRGELKRLLDQHDTVRGFEFEAYRKDGSKVWMSDNVRAVRDADGKLLYYEGTVEDVTERKEMEEALRRSEMDLADFFENAAIGLHWVSSDGTVLRINQAELDLVGYTRDECLGHNIAEFHADPDVAEDILKRLRSGEVLRDYEALLRTKDGSIKQVCISSSVYWEEGKFVHSRCFTRDVTERKQAEAAQRESEARYRDLVENSRDLICTHDLDGLLLSANPAAAAAVGYDLDELIGKKTVRDLLAPEVVDQFDEYMARLRREETTTGMMLVQTKSGEPRVWEYYNSLRTEGVATPIVRGMARDITEQRRVEKAMSALRRELELTMNSMQEGVHRVDLHGNIVFENPAAARMLGWEVAELLGKPAHLTMHHTRKDGTTYPKGECPIYAAFRDGISRHVTDEVFWRRDGTSFPVEYLSAPVRNDRNEIVAIVVTFQDITDRKRVERALQASERRYRDIFTFAPVGIYQARLNGTLITVNRALTQMLAYDSVDEFLEVNLADVYYAPDGRKKLIRDYEGRGFAVDLEVQWKRKDGTPIWVQLSAHAIKRPDGTTEYFEGFVRDINDRKLTEAALRRSEERYRELFENDKDAIYLHDLNGVYTSVNRAAEKMSGYSRAEIIGKHFWDFVSPEYLRQVGENLDKKLEELGETNYEVEIINRDGARVPVEVSSRLIYENGVAVGVQGSARDITERKRAQQALLTYSRRLLEAQEAERGRIARELHDQIGQMLTALKLNLHAIQTARNESEAQALIADNLKMIDGALEQVRNLSVDLRPLLLDDLGLVTALHWYVDHQAQRTGVRAEFISDSVDSDLRFSADLETACFRIAQEALTNVVRHARAKTVMVRLSRNRDYLILLIEDDGVGFDLEALQGLAQGSATLGLRGMQERAHAVGGRIKIDSATHKGTQVFVELPIAMPNGRKPLVKNA